MSSKTLCVFALMFRPKGRTVEGESSEQALLHARRYRFIIQYPFCRDYTICDNRFYQKSKVVIDTLVSNFSMISDLEFQYLDFLSSKNIVRNEEGSDNENIDDISEDSGNLTSSSINSKL